MRKPVVINTPDLQKAQTFWEMSRAWSGTDKEAQAKYSTTYDMINGLCDLRELKLLPKLDGQANKLLDQVILRKRCKRKQWNNVAQFPSRQATPTKKVG